MLGQLLIDYESAETDGEKLIIADRIKDWFCSTYNIPRKILEMRFDKGFEKSQKIALIEAELHSIRDFINAEIEGKRKAAIINNLCQILLKAE